MECLGANSDIEIHCVDTWKGGVEHDTSLMSEVEARFHLNTDFSRGRVPNDVNLFVHKGRSDLVLAKAIGEGKKVFSISFMLMGLIRHRMYSLKRCSLLSFFVLVVLWPLVIICGRKVCPVG